VVGGIACWGSRLVSWRSRNIADAFCARLGRVVLCPEVAGSSAYPLIRLSAYRIISNL
jgi:hypothetical protein